MGCTEVKEACLNAWAQQASQPSENKVLCGTLGRPCRFCTNWLHHKVFHYPLIYTAYKTRIYHLSAPQLLHPDLASVSFVLLLSISFHFLPRLRILFHFSLLQIPFTCFCSFHGPKEGKIEVMWQEVVCNSSLLLVQKKISICCLNGIKSKSNRKYNKGKSSQAGERWWLQMRQSFARLLGHFYFDAPSYEWLLMYHFCFPMVNFSC